MKNIWKKLNHNLGTKIVSLFFAILIWSFVMSVNDPLRTRTLTNVPLHIVGLEKLEDAGLIVRNDEVFNAVTMKVNIKISNTSLLNLNAVTVTADLSSIQRKGKYQIYLKGETTVGDVVSISPSVISLDVDERTTREIPVSYAYIGQMSDSMYHSDPTLSVTKVEITGAQQDVSKVTSAVVELDLSKIAESINGSYTLKLLNKDNQEVSSDQFVSTLPTVSVRMSVYPKKTVPLNADSVACISDISSLPAGYQVVGISFSQPDITVYGPAESLSSLGLVNIHPVSVKGLKATKTFQVTLVLPKGVTQISAVPITMTVMITKMF